MSDTHILHSSFKHGDSCMWRAIEKVVEILGPCFIYRVGTRCVCACVDNVYLCNVVTYVDISDTNIRLCDLFENEDWSFNRLQNQFPSFYQDCICSIAIDNDIN